MYEITWRGNTGLEVGPGVLQPSVKRNTRLSRVPNNKDRIETRLWPMLCAFVIFEVHIFSKRPAGALQFLSCSRTFQIA